MATLVDTIENADGGITDFYDDGSWIAYDQNQNVIDYVGAQVTHEPANPSDIVRQSDGSYFITDDYGTALYDKNGVFVAYQTADVSGRAEQALSDLGVPNEKTADGGFKIPGWDSLTTQQKKQITDKLGQLGGQWLAKQVGGNTVLYRKPSGGIGQLDIKSLLIPGAVIAALVLIS